jgi:formate dehydrogenase subunit gamma
VRDDREQPTLQPGNNAAMWREVRSGKPQTTTVQGVEAGVLMQSRGQAWRKLRPLIALGGAAVLLGAIGALFLFYRWRGPIRVAEPPTGRLIERFSFADRAAHWTMGISFVMLAVTGVILTFGRTLLIPVIGHTLFSWLAITAKSLHNFLGPLFMLSAAWFIVRFVRDNLPRRWDIDWLLKGGGMFTGAHVPSGRFNAGEKTLFWGLACFFSLILGASGLVLDFPSVGQGRSLMQDAQVIHMSVAMLAISASLFHMYLGTIGVEGAFAAMRDGTVDETWAREHHEIWYEDVKAGRARQRFASGESQDAVRAGMVAGRVVAAQAGLSGAHAADGHRAGGRGGGSRVA